MARVGGRGGRNPRDLPRDQQVSRKVSWLLRHGASQEGLFLGKGGYANVKDALDTRALRSLRVTFPELRQLVLTNDKQRFSLIPLSSVPEGAAVPTEPQAEGDHVLTQAIPTTFDGDSTDDPSRYLIRANQGHSLAVDTSGLLTSITTEAGNLPATVIHGTDEAAWHLILQSGGLKRMTRTHVHFARGLPAGMRSLVADEGGEEGMSSAPTATMPSSVSTSVADATNSSADASKPIPPTAPIPPPAELTFPPSSSAAADELHHRQKVISGIRPSSTIHIYIDLPAALAAGLPFHISENGVVLSEGNEEGIVPLKFFERVEWRWGGRGSTEGKVVMRDGLRVEGVEVAVRARVNGHGTAQGEGSGRGRRGHAAGRGKARARAVDDERDLMAGVE